MVTSHLDPAQVSPALRRTDGEAGEEIVCEEKPMSIYYALVSSLIFAAVAAAHLVRLLNRWAVQVGPYSVPMSLSWIGLVIAALISIWGFAQVAH